MHSTSSFTPIRLERIIAAPVATVFDAWLDPERLALFMKPDDGVGIARVENEPREGGSFLIVMAVGEKELPHRDEYLTIRHPHHLAFTWVSEGAGVNSVVRLDFEALGPRETRITLEHCGLPDTDSRDRHHKGWSAILARLADIDF